MIDHSKKDGMKIFMPFLESSSTMFIHTKIPKRWAYFVEVASFLKSRSLDVVAMDCLNPSVSHGEIFREVASTDYDLIILIARRETIRSIQNATSTIKEISPKTKILVYGDMVNYVPNFFKKVEGVDAVLESGDWEYGIWSYVKYLRGEITCEELAGVLNGSDWSNAPKGNIAPTEWWTFSDIDTAGFIEKDIYLSLTGGEITITVSKGCPFNCGICPAIITFGGKDRRISVESVIEYIKNHQEQVKSFKLFSPCFTYNVKWVKDFCSQLLQRNLKINWTCSSRPDCLQDKEMIELMGKSGCTKVALGVETLDPVSTKALRKFSKVENYIRVVEEVFCNLLKHGIEPKPLMMLGIDGQTKGNLLTSFDFLEKFGAKQIRCAAYSPRHELRKLDAAGDLTVYDIEKYDKMTYQHIDIPGVSREMFLKLVYSSKHFSKILY